MLYTREHRARRRALADWLLVELLVDEQLDDCGVTAEFRCCDCAA